MEAIMFTLYRFLKYSIFILIIEDILLYEFVVRLFGLAWKWYFRLIGYLRGAVRISQRLATNFQRIYDRGGFSLRCEFSVVCNTGTCNVCSFVVYTLKKLKNIRWILVFCVFMLRCRVLAMFCNLFDVNVLQIVYQELQGAPCDSTFLNRKLMYSALVIFHLKKKYQGYDLTSLLQF